MSQVYGPLVTVTLAVIFDVCCVLATVYLCTVVIDRVVEALKSKSTACAFLASPHVKKSIKFMLWMVGLAISMQNIVVLLATNLILQQQMLYTYIVAKNVTFVLYIVFVVLVAFSIMQTIKALENQWINDIKKGKLAKIDTITIDIVAKILKICVVTVFAMFLLERFGIGTSGVIAFGGMGGAAVAFASQNLLANFFGTLLIYLDRPFLIGEEIVIKEMGIEGRVEDIGWRITKILDKDHIPIFIPNANFSKVWIVNKSRSSNRHMLDKVGLQLSEKASIEHIGVLIGKLEVSLAKHHGIDLEQPITILLTDFVPKAVELTVDLYIKTTEYKVFQKIRQDIMLLVFNIAVDEGYNVIFSNDNKKMIQVHQGH
ncbi:mechanosensitive ion channel [Rickettsiales endosymbiont of Peranema trichophorum]|uniref:mechanosensitive ion channel family protein n=1 Tax=Rickettsiales endosymbiont of Peranema trichophorum TaxID=2486577 RepID=UPI001022F881|nr:mechanosensitive ion channel domain-containing protein [Rickettsiales endosymbiont of Peranema trichophorum]RZI47596.1 mechanosensitive ion channel [Rickettsiales endosymbiont of Peranema trichophorum]